MTDTQPRLYRPSFLLMAAANFFTLSIFSTFFLFPLFVLEHGGSKADIGILMGVMALSSVICRPWVAQMVDRIGRKKSYALGCFITAVLPLTYLLLQGSLADVYAPLFFIRLDSLENIDAVSGTGVVEPLTAADIHWLIIPAPGASKAIPRGTLYYVGASLTYTIGGEEHFTSVSPDYIFVKPMPELTLDYFLPSDVYGDDAFTDEIEPPAPFSLGLRAFNNGSGTAKDMKIDSAQPRITDNEQGLLIGFVIEACEINGRSAARSLLADFGDIGPGAVGSARWRMSCTLSGQFVAFDAALSHSDELGGTLTSLVDAADTHLLVRDVRVDLPGRDAVRDFLAKDGSFDRKFRWIDLGVIDFVPGAYFWFAHGHSPELDAIFVDRVLLIRLE